jgi:hypothetical protein
MIAVRSPVGQSRPRLVVAVLISMAAIAGVAPTAPAESGRRVVAIGEVQGAYESVVKILRVAELVDDQLRWSGGDAILIQTGDLIDDGIRVREVMDLFMRLAQEAEAAGGRVIVLLGNHEAMNILGLMHGVNYQTYETFAGEESREKQTAAYHAHVAWLQARAEAVDDPPPAVNEQFRSEWMAVHPPGQVEYVESMAPTGRYGEWLRTLPAAARIGDMIFLHGGISPALKGNDVDAINRKVVEEIRLFDSYRAAMVKAEMVPPGASARDMAQVIKAEIEYLSAKDPKDRDRSRVERAIELQGFQEWGSWYLVREDGPMWFTGASEWDATGHGVEMMELLDSIGASSMVSGQSAGSSPKIEPRFDGRVYLTSVGMSDDPWVKSEPACLEILDDEITVIMARGRQALNTSGD